jgi:hypothetical protein
MIERATRFGNLIFDRDAIVRAALRAYVEAVLHGLARFSFPACAVADWTGDLQRGALNNRDGCGAYDVVAWTEAGVVGLAYELGWGPLEHLDLPLDAVSGGPDDVRGALPDLPDKLEPALVIAAGMLDEGPNHGEKSAGVGFWLHGDHVAGTLFDDPINVGGSRLAAWGLLRDGRLLPLSSRASSYPRPGGIVVDHALPQDAPMHALMDAVVDRRLRGPTELTAEEIAMLFPNPPNPEHLLGARRMLQKVGITWPGSPEIPELPLPPLPRINPFTGQPMPMVEDESFHDMTALGLARGYYLRRK